MDEKAEVALEATSEAVPVEQASEATENTEGQAQSQPAEGEPPEERKTAAQERRERRKAHEQSLRDEAEAARRDAEAERRRSERILASTGQPPNEADFSDPIEYSAALGAYKARSEGARTDARFLDEDAKAAETRARDAEQRRIGLRVEAFRDQADEAKKVYADFDQVVALASDRRFVSDDLSLMILESDQAADLAYHLGKNPALAVQLSGMPPVAAARELGRIEASLASPKVRPPTKAPEPINPVNGRGAAPAKSVENMTLAEFAAWREAGGAPTKG